MIHNNVIGVFVLLGIIILFIEIVKLMIGGD
jgi:hypothetical protein